MTDAERIAEYMVRIGDMPAPFTAEDVRILAANNNDGDCGLPLAMLADVRREEREAALDAVDSELRLTNSGSLEWQRLSQVRRTIKARGSK